MTLFISCISIKSYCVTQIDYSYSNDEKLNKYYINPDDIRLISGKLFLSYSNGLVPLRSVSYDASGVAVQPENVILLPCAECGGWYVLGFQHNCNGVMR